MTHEDVDTVDAFCKAAMINRNHDPWLRKREKGAVYANITITDTNAFNAWWNPFVGHECMAELRFETGYHGERRLKEAVFVRLVNSNIHHGRSISPECFNIV